MNTQEVADKLVQLCRQGKNLEVINELYADNIVSHEPKGSHMELTEGKAAVLDKNNQWYAMVEEIHNDSVSDPLVSGDFFACAMYLDVTYKGMGRSEMNEIAVYEVKDGKIVSERFHYNVPTA